MIRYRREEQPENSEQQLVEEVKQHLVRLEDDPAAVPQTYWANLLVRTNGRIDDVTSARALSISWAGRVAIPGVVAIIFFFIGLHYYVPEVPSRVGSMDAFVNLLPETTVDSILAEPGRFNASLSGEDLATDIFQFSKEQITDYLVEAGNTEMAVDEMNDTDVAALISALSAKKNL
jgi:hypothetical protein